MIFLSEKIRCVETDLGNQMPRPHRHPSVTCYKKHQCRCIDCRKAYNADTVRRRKARRERGYALTDGTRASTTMLPDWELAYLRRAVGLE